MKKILLPILLVISILLHSNGGPIDATALLQTGQIVFDNAEGFSILEEHISFKIEGDYTLVEVIYKIENTNSANKVTYSFPIDISSWDSKNYKKVLEREVIDFEIISNDNKLEYTVVPPKNNGKINYIEIFDTSRNVKLDSDRIYYNTQLTFSKNEIKTLQVNYKVKNQLLELLTTKSMLPSHTERLFYYDVTPSKNWGNGIVNKFSYRIDFTDVFMKAGGPSLLPKGGYWKDYIYSFESTDYNLNKANDIVFSYDITSYLEANYFKKKQIKDINIVEIKASSTLAPEKNWDYEAKNLFDGNFKTVWVEGKEDNGIGEYIEIEIKDFYVGYIGVINGHNFSQKTYDNNSRLLQVKLELELDKNGKYFKGDESGKVTRVVDVKDIGFSKLTSNNYTTAVQELYDFGDFPAATKKIRIYIDKAMNGDIYNDLCISEIIILGYTYEEIN